VRAFVLNTDMAHHVSLLDVVADKVRPASQEGADLPHAAAARWRSDTMQAILSSLIHGADVASAARPPWLAGMWARALHDEFFAQGALEAEKNLPLTPYFCQDGVTIWQAQVWDHTCT
jgi:3'5'-cyclic nucleotide phosphodiesterase